MAVSASFKRADTGTEITNLTFTDMTPGVINPSDIGKIYVEVTGATSVVNILLGLLSTGSFTSGDDLTYENFYYRISPDSEWTQFSGLSSDANDVDNVSIFDGGNISKQFEIGLKPNVNNLGTLDGNTVIIAYYTYT
mgnify:CR=1 FL=1